MIAASPPSAAWERLWGHAHVARALQQALARGRAPQSLLFSGPPSVGKTLAATLTAQALLCADAVAPCGACRSCLAVEQRAHPDCLWLESAGPTTAIPIETVRVTLQQLHQTPVQGSRHVAVILAIEQLSEEGATTLLKTIEEPPPSTHLVLTTHDVGRCLPTIASRCQLLRLAPLGREHLAARLIATQHVSPDIARRAAVLAEGRVGKALQLLAVEKLPTVDAFFEQLTGAKEWSAERRAELFELLEQYLWWCRDRLCHTAGCGELAAAPTAAVPGVAIPTTVDASSDVLAEALELLDALEHRVNPKLIQWLLQQRWTSTSDQRPATSDSR